MKNYILGLVTGLTIATGSVMAYDWDLNRSFSDNQNAQKQEELMERQNQILQQQQFNEQNQFRYRAPC